MIDINPNHLEIIRDILASHVPDAEVRAFGSRVTGSAKSSSDLDLVIMGDSRLTFTSLGLLRYDFEESDLPYRVDLLDWHMVTDEFREIIAKDCEIMQASGAALRGPSPAS